jgi:hypothetical protein
MATKMFRSIVVGAVMIWRMLIRGVVISVRRPRNVVPVVFGIANRDDRGGISFLLLEIGWQVITILGTGGNAAHCRCRQAGKQNCESRSSRRRLLVDCSGGAFQPSNGHFISPASSRRSEPHRPRTVRVQCGRELAFGVDLRSWRLKMNSHWLRRLRHRCGFHSDRQILQPE